MNDSDDFGLLLIVVIWVVFLVACVFAVVTGPHHDRVWWELPTGAVRFEGETDGH